MNVTFRISIGVSLLGAIAACQNTENTGSAGAGSGGGGGHKAEVEIFSPKGCAFSIAGRSEYKDFKKSTDVTKPDPKIRRVRIGLGGKQDHGVSGHADPSTSAGFAWQTDDGTLVSDVAWGKDPDPKNWS